MVRTGPDSFRAYVSYALLRLPAKVQRPRVVGSRLIPPTVIAIPRRIE
jgi:hypothetical protein